MRLKNLAEYYIMQRRVIRDEQEGGRYEGFSEMGVPVMAHIYDKKSQVTDGTAGMKRESVKLMLIDMPHKAVYDTETKQEQGPDYRVREIADPGHLECKLERIG